MSLETNCQKKSPSVKTSLGPYVNKSKAISIIINHKKRIKKLDLISGTSLVDKLKFKIMLIKIFKIRKMIK